MFHFKTKVSRVGTSYAVIIPKPIIDFFHLTKGSELILTADENGIHILPSANQIQPDRTLLGVGKSRTLTDEQKKLIKMVAEGDKNLLVVTKDSLEAFSTQDLARSLGIKLNKLHKEKRTT